MPAAARLNDRSQGHGGFPPTEIISTPVTKTIINGKLAAVVDSEAVPHTAGRVTHRNRKITAGSSKVIIEGKAAARTGDPFNCGDTAGPGSSNTVFGG